jgi:AcrR family transcriptional regulator
MTSKSSKKRTYRSPRRQRQAQATRRTILEAANRLFLEHGYAATTLTMCAHAAGVSLPTVTSIFGTKLGLLDAVIKLGVREIDTEAPLAERPVWRDMLAELDPAEQLRKFAAIGRQIHERTTDIAEIVRGAATADPDIAALRRKMTASRLQDNRLVAESLARKNALGAGWTAERAADVFWVLGSSDLYRMLVVDRNWSPDQYERWLASALAQVLR